ncbi:hypothetical protein GCM10020254_32620 [Streptomyces goshikiensis]
MPAIWAAMRAQDPRDAAADSPEMLEFLRGRWLATVPEQLIGTGRALISEPDRIDDLVRVAPELPKLVLSGGQRPGLAGVGDGRHGPAPRRGAGGDPGYGALAERRGAGRDGGGAGRVLGGLRAVTPSGR